jgi:hypothetical protein
VGCPERVRAGPFKQREVSDHPRVVMALAAQREVFMHTEAAQPHRLPVEQETGAVHLNSPDTDRQRAVCPPCSICLKSTTNIPFCETLRTELHLTEQKLRIG